MYPRNTSNTKVNQRITADEVQWQLYVNNCLDLDHIDCENFEKQVAEAEIQSRKRQLREKIAYFQNKSTMSRDSFSNINNINANYFPRIPIVRNNTYAIDTTCTVSTKTNVMTMYEENSYSTILEVICDRSKREIWNKRNARNSVKQCFP